MVSKETFSVNGLDTLKCLDAKEVIEFLEEQTRYALNEYRLVLDYKGVLFPCGTANGAMDFDVIKSSDRDSYSKGHIKLNFNYTMVNKGTEVIFTANKITRSSVYLETDYIDSLFNR